MAKCFYIALAEKQLVGVDICDKNYNCREMMGGENRPEGDELVEVAEKNALSQCKPGDLAMFTTSKSHLLMTTAVAVALLAATSSARADLDRNQLHGLV
jgi:hypothetical protein